MSAPIWMAAPPEVHSALLSSGPGPGPLLASAGAWESLSTAYAETADELAALVAGAQADSWEGPSAAEYAAAHAPYLAWLTQASADSAAMAARQQTAATAYTAAVAAMPTLAELAANHAAHAVLTATNFFGINTISIAINEAEYVRMWLQAAAVMGAYHAVSTAAVVAGPQSPPAPPIMKADGELVRAAEAGRASSDPLRQFEQWLWQMYTTFYDNVIQPFVDWLANLPFFQTMFAGIDPYLVILGNPLTYLSPLNIAFALGYPMDIGTYVALLSQTFTFIGADLAAAFATGNPVTIGFTILFTGVEAIGTIITDTIALLKTLLEQTAALLTVVVPLLTAPLLPIAAGAVLAPIGVKGLVAVAAVPPPPPPVTPSTPPLAALGASAPPSATTPIQPPVETSVQAPTPGPPPPAAAAPPVSDTGLGGGMANFGYLVGGLSADAKGHTGTRSRKAAPESEGAEAPAAAATPQEKPRRQWRRRVKAKQLGRGYEYLDLEPSTVAAEHDPTTSVAPDQGGETLGFAGTTQRARPRPAAGLIAPPDDIFPGSPRAPMLPGTWDVDSALPRDSPSQ
ncbi:PPE family protein [Mycobacterium attenuatum]|uniref:PPE family protein n=1 Tax=Mycobacterium attenuatum TaxID=2341086 RepID=UPI000F04438E|nr:PPE family protein [Mycobacterium attenuatum]VBA52237.1 putative PPE family protein PPE2 [Mycobacterium attenuatum]